MSGAGAPVSGRAVLAARLGLLQAELRQRGKTQKAAVEEANRRRRRIGGRSEDVPWPRRDGGVDLSVQAVNDWFPKQKGSKEPSVPSDFEDLWSVIAVMLEWTGRLTDRWTAGRLRSAWRELHNDAQLGNGLDDDVHGYLEAVKKAAEQHPYPGVPGLKDPPALAQVYVRQQSKQLGEAVFRKTDQLCVVFAGPGHGKSTLLRTLLREAAGEWLDGVKRAGTTGRAVPVLVSARALAGEETHVLEALSAATRRLSRYGRHPGIDRSRFLDRPCTGAHWQLLVDGLDELPNAQERRAVLEKLANVVAEGPSLYRCVVATRPPAENDLAVLERVLGRPAPRYELLPFTADDLCTYIEKYFSTRWPQEEAAHHTHQLVDALRSTHLGELSHTPLMAFMLCQLYLADPERPLPSSRTAVHGEFADLLYENNRSKHVAASHEEAIEHLLEGIQSPRAFEEADNAARRVREELPELIDYLAHEWLVDHPFPWSMGRGWRRPAAAKLLASHQAVRRPGKVRPELWDTFLEDLLRHTGLLVDEADGLDFSHQTFLEFHAARHATSDREISWRTLHELFDFSEPMLSWSELEPSYVGLLLDRLLASPDGQIRAETERNLDEILAINNTGVCEFLVGLAAAGISLPAPERTVRLLTRFANDPGIAGFARVEAAMVLSRFAGHEAHSTQLLEALTNDHGLRAYEHTMAADALTVRRRRGRRGE